MPDAGPYNHQYDLNHMAPAAKRAALGDVLNDLITNFNAMLATMDSTGAALNATGSITVGGSITAADTIQVTLSNAAMAALPVTLGPIVVVGGNTTTILATDINNLINASAPLAAGKITATSTAAVVHITQPGVLGNLTVITYSLSGSASETLTLSNSGTLTGGSGTVGNGNVAALTVTPIQNR